MIMQNDNMRIVNFRHYCQRCKHFKKEEYEDPCRECLHHPVNANSHKPVKFEEVKK